MMEDKDYIDCIYNWWSGFAGKETCDAGYLICKGERCPMYHKAEEGE